MLPSDARNSCEGKVLPSVELKVKRIESLLDELAPVKKLPENGWVVQQKAYFSSDLSLLWLMLHCIIDRTTAERTEEDSLGSYDRFRERVRTYEPVLWKGKPISPFSAALHGWQLVDKDLLGCVTCDRVVSARLPCPSRVQLCEPCSFLMHLFMACVFWHFIHLDQSCSRWLKEKLRDKGHEKECPWRGSPCPQEFLNVPILSKNDRDLISTLSTRCSHLATLSSLENLNILGADDEKVGNAFFPLMSPQETSVLPALNSLNYSLLPALWLLTVTSIALLQINTHSSEAFLEGIA